ncbi:hypothetical protein RORB6_03710 [Raoultella ornithinolytica B6]|nr:hypothetical protein RORB6_03710 [Raoultella ornithinolytica B6]
MDKIISINGTNIQPNIESFFLLYPLIFTRKALWSNEYIRRFIWTIPEWIPRSFIKIFFCLSADRGTLSTNFPNRITLRNEAQTQTRFTLTIPTRILHTLI